MDLTLQLLIQLTRRCVQPVLGGAGDTAVTKTAPTLPSQGSQSRGKMDPSQTVMTQTGWGRDRMGEGRPRGFRSEAGELVTKGEGPFKVVIIKTGSQKSITSVTQIALLWSLIHKSIRIKIFSIRIGKQNLEQVLGYNTLFLSLCGKSFHRPIKSVEVLAQTLQNLLPNTPEDRESLQKRGCLS